MQQSAMRNEEREREKERGIQNHSLNEIYDILIARPLGMIVFSCGYRAVFFFFHRLRCVFRIFLRINK